MPLSPTELVIVSVIILVFFGGSQIPKFARSLREARDELTASDHRA